VGGGTWEWLVKSSGGPVAGADGQWLLGLDSGLWRGRSSAAPVVVGPVGEVRSPSSSSHALHLVFRSLYLHATLYSYI
jgi:hypothetical protein